MPNTMTLISSATVGSGGTTQINFTSIPQTYTDLKVELSARGDGYNANDLYMLFNTSTSNYSGKYFMKDSSDPAPVSSISQTSKIICGFIPASQATANTWGSTTVYVPNYTTSNYKTTNSESCTENNGVIQWILIAGGLWADTAAITTLSLNLNGATFLQNTTAFLYGIKRA